MGRLLLVLGGARSGKSAYAQRLAQELGGDHVLFVATAEAWDEDMTQRIARHRQERPATWRTLETPRQVGPAIALHLYDTAVVLVDCLTLLVSNTLLHCGASPDSAAAEAALVRLKEDAAAEGRNLMEPIMDASRAYVTMGEMCDALRDVWGTWRETPVF